MVDLLSGSFQRECERSEERDRDGAVRIAGHRELGTVACFLTGGVAVFCIEN